MAVKQFDVALSLAGRDTGSLYVVSQLIDENHCSVIDGKTKPISKPKKKKFKHIKVIGSAASEFEGVFEDKSKTNDAKVRKILKEFEEKI